MRRLVIAGVLGLCGLCAQAQTEKRPLSPAQSLSCLVKSGTPPRFPKRHLHDKSYSGLRVLLKFAKPDAAPDVEVLFNSAPEDMQDAAYHYLRSYRLPCLTAQDGVVSAVQEFNFVNTDRDASPFPTEPAKGRQPFCVVRPRDDMSFPDDQPRKIEHVVVAATFTGDGGQPPEVKIIHSTSTERVERHVRRWLAEYRMPCRKAGDEPQGFQQLFTVVPNGHRRFVLKRDSFTLHQLLRATREPRKLKGYYDLNTMGCPFKVTYTLYGAGVSNEAVVAGPPDPNKQPFLNWLAGLELALTAEQANDLFGTTLQINVDCGTVDLDGQG